jgi:hypothetical protein
MSYSGPEYNVRHKVMVDNDYSFGTSTAAGTASNSFATVGLGLPTFLRRQTLTGLQLVCRTIPNAAATALKAYIMNGTTTAAEVTLTTATAGQSLTGTVTATNATFAADVKPTITVIGTATASGGALGVYDIFFETKEAFSA